LSLLLLTTCCFFASSSATNSESSVVFGVAVRSESDELALELRLLCSKSLAIASSGSNESRENRGFFETGSGSRIRRITTGGGACACNG
jgi:hypothetical protein